MPPKNKHIPVNRLPTTAVADLVIGADGYRSAIRPYVTAIKERYSGATIIKGEIDDPENDCRDIFPLDQNWHANATITLIGDAAHLMPPSGEGVSTAMLDALDLSECLTCGDFNDLQAAIGAYEQQMRARAAVLGQEALEGIKDFASPSEASIQKMLQLFGSNG